MNGVALIFFGLDICTSQFQLPRDVRLTPTRSFAMPVQLAAEHRAKLDRIRLYVSEDRGKSWKYESSCAPNGDRFIFTAPEDGLYWFALQVVEKDGKFEPPNSRDFVPVLKVFVNSEGRKFIVPRTYGELVDEVGKLKMTVSQLEKKIRELEASQVPK